MKKEKRNLFKMFFNNKKQMQNITKTQLQMLNSYEATFTTLGDNTYDSKVARQCIDRIATHCAKLINRLFLKSMIYIITRRNNRIKS